jgi:flagellar hook-length control protein FliK
MIVSPVSIFAKSDMKSDESAAASRDTSADASQQAIFSTVLHQCSLQRTSKQTGTESKSAPMGKPSQDDSQSVGDETQTSAETTGTDTQPASLQDQTISNPLLAMMQNQQAGVTLNTALAALVLQQYSVADTSAGACLKFQNTSQTEEVSTGTDVSASQKSDVLSALGQPAVSSALMGGSVPSAGASVMMASLSGQNNASAAISVPSSADGSGSSATNGSAALLDGMKDSAQQAASATVGKQGVVQTGEQKAAAMTENILPGSNVLTLMQNSELPAGAQQAATPDITAKAAASNRAQESLTEGIPDLSVIPKSDEVLNNAAVSAVQTGTAGKNVSNQKSVKNTAGSKRQANAVSVTIQGAGDDGDTQSGSGKDGIASVSQNASSTQHQSEEKNTSSRQNDNASNASDGTNMAAVYGQSDKNTEGSMKTSSSVSADDISAASSAAVTGKSRFDSSINILHVDRSGAQKNSEAAENSKAVMDQLINNITLQIQGKTSQMKIMLQPESLGDVFIKVKMDEGKIQAEIDVSNPATKVILDNNIGQLQQSLHQRGIDVHSIEVIANTQFGLGNSESNSSSNNSAKGGKTHYEIKEEDVGIQEDQDQRDLGYNTMELTI